jgi:hypothetical protein
MMAVSGLFLLLYGLFRFGVEFVRVPDAHIGYLAFDWLTMGQVLSLPMVLAGTLLLLLAYGRRTAPGCFLTASLPDSRANSHRAMSTRVPGARSRNRRHLGYNGVL